jgi:hypothetical protein
MGASNSQSHFEPSKVEYAVFSFQIFGLVSGTVIAAPNKLSFIKRLFDVMAEKHHIAVIDRLCMRKLSGYEEGYFAVNGCGTFFRPLLPR